MRAIIIVVIDPVVQIILQCLYVLIKHFAKCDLVNHLQDWFVEALTDTIDLRWFGLGFGVINTIQRQVELLIETIGPATIPSAAIRQNTQQMQHFLY